MSATASDLIRAGRDVHQVNIECVESAIEIVGMTVSQAIKFSEVAQSKTDDHRYIYAYLIKLCCPAFSGFWWTPNRIASKLTLKVMLALAEHIMEVSGYRSDAAEQAAKQ